MIANRKKSLSYKAMKLNYYQPSDKPTYVGGIRDVHFLHYTHFEMVKKMKKLLQKQREKNLISRPLLQTLSGYIEARKCRTLDNFTKGEKNE